MDWIIKLLMGVCFVMVLALFFILGVSITSEHISIPKSSFTCTQSHKQLRLMPSGKVTVPVWDNICDQYTRNN